MFCVSSWWKDSSSKHFCSIVLSVLLLSEPPEDGLEDFTIHLKVQTDLYLWFLPIFTLNCWLSAALRTSGAGETLALPSSQLRTQEGRL